jgi:ribosomal protein S18 acetylase RimI-like enzyme
MIHIRTANRNDLEIIRNLDQEVFIDNQKYDSDLKMDWTKSGEGINYFTNLLNDHESCCLIAEDAEKPVGYIIATPRKITYFKTKHIEINGIGVTPKYQSQGIGSLLIEECIAWAKLKGYEKIYVNSYYKNTKAINFYKKGGFSEIDISLQKNIQ